MVRIFDTLGGVFRLYTRTPDGVCMITGVVAQGRSGSFRHYICEHPRVGRVCDLSPPTASSLVWGEPC